ncbi:MAG: hypothetical protein J7501_02765 [Bdellovibrio sp.]|nr:hypothetical protein [Bdellovibrio sp.]
MNLFGLIRAESELLEDAAYGGAGILILLTPLMLLIPKFNEFLNASPKEAGAFLDQHYPQSLGPIAEETV